MASPKKSKALKKKLKKLATATAASTVEIEAEAPADDDTKRADGFSVDWAFDEAMKRGVIQ